MTQENKIIIVTSKHHIYNNQATVAPYIFQNYI